MALGGISLAPLQVDIKANIAGFKDEMNKVATAGVGAAQRISKELSQTMKVGENFKKVGSTLTKSLTLPLVGVGVASGKLALDFEQSFAKVSTLLDSSGVDFDVYKKDLLKASSESGIAVGEFSEAVYGAISAGVDQTKAIGFTTEAMKLAKGGFTSGSKAVDVMTTAINGYKLKTEDATKVSDMLITTQNLGKTTVDELASSIGSVIPVASAANFGIEELSTGYALMTKNGIATAEAGTYMKSMLGELTSAGSKTDKVLRNLTGKGFADLKKEGMGTTEILGTLTEHAEKNGMVLKDMFGSTEAGSAAMVLASGAGAEYNEILKAMGSSAGSTQEAFEKIDASPIEQFKKAFNELKNAGIELGIQLLPIVTNVTEWITKLAQSFTNLTPEGQKTVLIVGGMIAALGSLLTIVGSGIGLFVNLQVAFGFVSAAATAAGVSVGAFLLPIGLIVAGVAGLAIAIATDFGGIRTCIVDVMNSVKDIITSIVTTIKNLWENNFLGIQIFTTGLFEHMKLIFKTVFDAISDIFKIFSALFKGDWEGVWNGIKIFVCNLWENIKSVFNNFLNTIVDTLLSIGVNLLNAAVSSFNKIKEGATNAWNALKTWFSGAINDPIGTIKGISSSMYSAGKEMLNSVWDGCKSIWSSITGWFSEKVNWIKDKLTFWKSSKSEMSDGVDGSHYNGLSYVPFDGYVARLHKGERVITAKENKEFNQGTSQYNKNNKEQEIIIKNYTVLDGEVVADKTNRVLGNKSSLEARGIII
ncbi:MAG: phage tail tape measure protein [Bacilli bacterium]